MSEVYGDDGDDITLSLCWWGSPISTCCTWKICLSGIVSFVPRIQPCFLFIILYTTWCFADFCCVREMTSRSNQSHPGNQGGRVQTIWKAIFKYSLWNTLATIIPCMKEMKDQLLIPIIITLITEPSRERGNDLSSFLKAGCMCWLQLWAGF